MFSNLVWTPGNPLSCPFIATISMSNSFLYEATKDFFFVLQMVFFFFLCWLYFALHLRPMSSAAESLVLIFTLCLSAWGYKPMNQFPSPASSWHSSLPTGPKCVWWDVCILHCDSKSLHAWNHMKTCSGLTSLSTTFTWDYLKCNVQNY